MAYFNPERPSYLFDPYPALARLRGEEPVHWSRQVDAWVVTSYRHCAEVLYDHERFSSARDGAPYDASEPRPLVTTDAPDHDRLRSVIAPALSPRSVHAAAARLGELVSRRISALPHAEPFDFVSIVATPLPQEAIVDYAGLGGCVTVDDARLLTQSSNADDAGRADVFRNVLRDVPAESESIAGAIARGVAHQSLTEAEGIHLLADVLSAGSDATSFALSNAVAALCSHPREYTSLPVDALPEAAVEELLRFDSSTQAAMRTARRPASLGRRKVAAGERVLLMLGAANRDPDVFAEPDELNLERKPNRHLSFAVGGHYCLGAPLARQVIGETLRQLRVRFDQLSIGPAGGERRGNFALRGFARLEVTGT